MQSHLLQCPELVCNLKYLDVKPSKLNENFIYGNIQQQDMMVKIYSDVLDAREMLKETIHSDATWERKTLDENIPQ